MYCFQNENMEIYEKYFRNHHGLYIKKRGRVNICDVLRIDV